MPISVLFCRLPHAVSATAPPPGLQLRAVCADRDAHDIVRLCHEVAAAGTSASAEPGGRGLLAELSSRPGRRVEAWLALMPLPDSTGERLAGMISLVQSRSPLGIRHSIGWLLVHPHARRRGVARAMVAHACRHAADLDAGTVWAECRSDWAESLAFWRAVGFQERA